MTALEASERFGGKVRMERIGNLLVEPGQEALFVRDSFAPRLAPAARPSRQARPLRTQAPPERHPAWRTAAPPAGWRGYGGVRVPDCQRQGIAPAVGQARHSRSE